MKANVIFQLGKVTTGAWGERQRVLTNLWQNPAIPIKSTADFNSQFLATRVVDGVEYSIKTYYFTEVFYTEREATHSGVFTLLLRGKKWLDAPSKFTALNIQIPCVAATHLLASEWILRDMLSKEFSPVEVSTNIEFKNGLEYAII